MKSRARFIAKAATIVCAVTVIILFSYGEMSAEDQCCPLCEKHSDFATALPDNKLKWEQLNASNMEEHIFLIGFFDQGVEMFSTVFAFKYGPMLRYGYYSFVYENSTKKKWFAKGECEAKTRKMSYAGLDVECGAAFKFSGKWPNYKYQLNAPEFQADLNMNAIVKPFDVGMCYYQPDKSVYLDTKMFIPRGKISGKLILDKKAREVSGQAYGDHNLMNVPPLRQGPFLLALRIFPDSKTPPEDQIYINVSNQALNQKFGGGFDRFVVVIKGSEVLGFSRFIEVEKIAEGEHKETGYKYVKQAAIKARGDNFTLKGVFTVDEVIEIMDIYQWLPDWAKKIAEKFWKRPVYFRFLGKFDGTLDVGGEKKIIKQMTTAEMNFTQ